MAWTWQRPSAGLNFDPCGMVVDFGRSCFTRTVYPWLPAVPQGSAEQGLPTTIARGLYFATKRSEIQVWYFTLPGALPLPMGTYLDDPDWLDMYDAAASQYGPAPRIMKDLKFQGPPPPEFIPIYNDGKAPALASGTHFCGKPEQFLAPQPWNPNAPVPVVGFSGLPICCTPGIELARGLMIQANHIVGALALGIGIRTSGALGLGIRAPERGAVALGVNPQEPGALELGVRSNEAGALELGVRTDQAGALELGVRTDQAGALELGVHSEASGALGLGVRSLERGAIVLGVNPQESGALELGANVESSGALELGANVESSGANGALALGVSTGQNGALALGVSTGQNGALALGVSTGQNGALALGTSSTVANCLAANGTFSLPLAGGEPGGYSAYESGVYFTLCDFTEDNIYTWLVAVLWSGSSVTNAYAYINCISTPHAFAQYSWSGSAVAGGTITLALTSDTDTCCASTPSTISVTLGASSSANIILVVSGFD